MSTSTRPVPRCNVERLVHAMRERDIDGLVVTQPYNVYYLSGFNATAHKSDEPRPYAVVLSRQAPRAPVLVVPDYYLGTFLTLPTWIEDIRPFRAVMMPLDIAPSARDIERFIPQAGRGRAWFEQARARYAFDMSASLHGALADLGLKAAKLGFDDLGTGVRLGIGMDRLRDAYDCMMDARSIKTQAEIQALDRASALNEQAIRKTIAGWDPAMTWAELTRVYGEAVLALGGFVRDPGGMVWGHPPGGDAAITLQTGTEQDKVVTGTNVMFDCHGTLDLYCWDGGKTWVAGAELSALARRHAKATTAAGETLLEAMRPGARISALQARAREAFRKAGHPDAEAAVIFFHGLGLSHMDIPMARADGRPNADWTLEENMVVPMHLLCPGGFDERWWLEEVVHVTRTGGRPLSSWGLGPL
jgi:Xaa-Pro aminopeptidase